MEKIPKFDVGTDVMFFLDLEPIHGQIVRIPETEISVWLIKNFKSFKVL